jgi:hypothetical protein
MVCQIDHVCSAIENIPRPVADRLQTSEGLDLELPHRLELDAQLLEANL